METRPPKATDSYIGIAVALSLGNDAKIGKGLVDFLVIVRGI